jgi:hypothetical protein
MDIKTDNTHTVDESVLVKSELAQYETESHIVGNALLVANDGHVRLVPIPTHDPNDPLNFSNWRKAGIIFSCCWFCTPPTSSLNKVS